MPVEIETVTIFRNWVELAASLKTDSERGKLYHAVCEYSLYGKEPELEGLLLTCFKLIQPVINKSNKRKIAQQKSLQMRLQNSLQNNPQNKPDSTLQNDSQNDIARARKEKDKDKGKDKGIDKEKDKGKDKKTVPSGTEKETPVSFVDFLPDHLQNSLFCEKWKEWETYRRSKRKPISQSAFRQMKKLLDKMTPDEATAAINTSIANDWQGLFPPKKTAQHPCRQPAGKDYSGV